METKSVETPPEDPKKSLKKQISESEPRTSGESVQLFASLDLVNSTAFKAKTPKWPIILDKFYTLSESNIIHSQQVDDVDRFRVWKYIGDEVLFHRAVHRLQDIPNSIVHIFEKINEISRAIRSLCTTEKLPVGLLDVKATIWLALIHHSPDIDPSQNQKNILRHLGQSRNAREFDFLGPDIDSGFRVAAHADKRKVAISAKLGGVLLHHECRTVLDDVFLNYFKVVYYARLKGIWHGAPYPIIWFHKDWNNIKQTFSYTEQLNPGKHDLGDFAGKQAIQNVLNGHALPLSTIKDALPIHGEQDDIEKIIETVKNVTIDDTKRFLEGIRHPLAEVHVAAIVLSNDGTKVLLAKRSSKKTIFPSCLEFGCAQLAHGDDPEDLLTREYKKDFGIDIEIKKDILVGTYSIKRPDYSVPGFLFVATANNAMKPTPTEKHSDVQWLDIDMLKHPSDSMLCVPNLNEHVMRAWTALEFEAKPGKTS